METCTLIFSNASVLFVVNVGYDDCSLYVVCLCAICTVWAHKTICLACEQSPFFSSIKYFSWSTYAGCLVSCNSRITPLQSNGSKVYLLLHVNICLCKFEMGLHMKTEIFKPFRIPTHENNSKIV